MRDNELYHAMREGRIRVQVELESVGDQWKASYNGFGMDVSVTDDSQTYAQSQVIEKVLEQVRDGKFEVRHV